VLGIGPGEYRQRFQCTEPAAAADWTS
jgi:hypothetical protein